MNTPHIWRFYRSGGFDQVRLDTAEDLFNLEQLDQKLWVALSCPTTGLQFDADTLRTLDLDQDGYIRAPELIAALQWLREVLLHPELLADGADAVPLAAINAGHPDGQEILRVAKRILQEAGKPEADTLTVAETSASVALFAAQPLNGDGIITPTSTQNPLLQGLITRMVDVLGGTPDSTGETGVTLEQIEQFFAEAESLQAWRSSPQDRPADFPLGSASAAALDTLKTVRDKVDDYFTRCRLASFDERAGALLNASEENLLALSTLNLASEREGIAALPLATIAPGKALPLDAAVLNPAWSDQIMALGTQIITPLLGAKTVLSEAEWQQIRDTADAFGNWLSSQPVTALSVIPVDELATLTSPELAAGLRELVKGEIDQATDSTAIHKADQLTRFTRDLASLCRNFVSFQSFYNGTEKALFQAGTLYLDGRSCDLCIQVTDPTTHAELATLSGIYLAYCKCVRGETDAREEMTIAAGFTAGDSDQLMVGRNGLFYDRLGQDWHATIIKVVDHPISLRQAFWSPYKKLVRAISQQLQKMAAARSQAMDASILKQAEATTNKATTVAAKNAPPPPPPQPVDAARFAGIFAAIGLALGAIGTAIASVVSGFMGLAWWQMPLAILAVILVISTPAVLLAWFKLRNRNLAPMLDANGWAINSRAKINLPFGRSLTQLATLPAGAERSLQDPYAEKRVPWLRYGLLSGVVAGGLIYARFFL